MLLQIVAFLVIAISIFLLLIRFSIRRVSYTKPTLIDNKVIIITGGSTGIGKACAIDLAKRGGKIYIACRDEPINEKAFEDIRKESGSDNIHFLGLNLASIKSIQKFSAKFHKLESKLDILINNAGVLTTKKQYTEDGFEMHIGVNYLGHFLLTNLLLDLLKASAPSRIIFAASAMHRISTLKDKDLMSDTFFFIFKTYGMSKLAIILFTRELARKLEGTKVTVNCCHPGVVNSQITQELIGSVLTKIYSYFTKTTLEGAQNYIKLAVDPDLNSVSGKYFKDCQKEEPSIEARDVETSKWLWEKSSELVSINKHF